MQVYQQPDIIIDHLNDDPKSPLVVEIIMPYCGSLGVNSFFKDAIKSSSKEQKRKSGKKILKELHYLLNAFNNETTP